MATRCRARTCLCRATRFKRFSVRSSSTIVSVFGGGRRTRTLTGWPSSNSRVKSSSERSSHPAASRFRARCWAAVNFCATVDTSVEFAAPCPVRSPLSLYCARTISRGSREMATMTRVPTSVHRHLPSAVKNSVPIWNSECFIFLLVCIYHCQIQREPNGSGDQPRRGERSLRAEGKPSLPI